VAVEDAVRREIVDIGSLVDREQSWRLVYVRCGHGVQFSRRDLPNVEDAERLVREFLATCQECAELLPPVPREDLVGPALRDFWCDQHGQPPPWPTLAGAPWKD